MRSAGTPRTGNAPGLGMSLVARSTAAARLGRATALWPGSTRLLLCAVGLWALALASPGPWALLLTPAVAMAGFACLGARHHLGVGLILFACLATVQLFAAAGGPGPVGGPGTAAQRSSVAGLVVGRGEPGTSGWSRLTVASTTGLVEVLSPSVPAVGSRVEMTTESLGDIRITRTEPAVLEEPGPLWQWRNEVRAQLREDSLSTGHRGGRLLPGLVVGDTAPQDARMRDDMRIVSLSHVSAVSGTNVTIVVVGAGLFAGLCRAGPRTRVGVGMLTCAFYLIIVGFEPSAIRAAAMAIAVALVFLRGGGISPVAVISASVCTLLSLVPLLASTVGFVLSVASTAAIMFVVPPLVRVLTVRLRRVPALIVSALAVPLIAQLACTPVLVAIDPKVGLWSVPANALAGPAVLPATVLGFLALVCGGLGLLGVPVIAVCATVFAWAGSACAWWIVAVAQLFAGLPGAALDWPAPPWGTVIALVLLVIAGAGAWLVLRWRLWGIPVLVVAVALTALVVVAQRGRLPAADWVVLVCDVGQGSATVVNLGAGTGLVVDTGEEPKPVDECLDTAGVEDVELVISHFDADHSAGWEGTTWSRSIERLWLSPNAASGEAPQRIAEGTGAEVVTVQRGRRMRLGAADIEILWPPAPAVQGPTQEGSVQPGPAEQGSALSAPTQSPGQRNPLRPAEDSAARNEESLVLRIEIGGLSLLAPGDIGEDEQFVLAQSLQPVDVLLAPHHGSSDLSEDFYTAAGARLGAVSVGDNSYGHPTRRSLSAFGPVPVARTDRCGTIAIYPDARFSTERTCR
ncbi:competence protein ComEC [Brevibacterium sanguinis]|uniref:Competence protein ComEC n=3 Tax=Brevibacteriaceae TaxID=85019 RepID=A0A366IGT8_9MICO|nr:competence protein ComEC [Brevibacterium sanguinis]RBP70779.1 competence protein ComEC [Brevibacterium celere]